MNNRKRILYISTNDGSDVRVYKEVKSLSVHYDVIYSGVGKMSDTNFAKNHSAMFHLINGKRNTVPTLARHFFFVFFILLTKRIHSIHVLNEQLMIFFYPLLFFKHTVLDLFDSIFLLKNKGGNKLRWLKWVIYLPVNKIIVTDESRKNLLPVFFQKKTIILENYPYRYNGPWNKRPNGHDLTIFFNGAIAVNRGLYVLQELLLFEKIKIIMAGWAHDEMAKNLVINERVDFRGVLTQSEIQKIAANEADYILCMYAPVNENNINASPNKIYDSIQVRTPVIINAEVKASRFVKNEKLGFVLEAYHLQDINKVVEMLKELKGKFLFPESLVNACTWENIENRLIAVHNL
ncbi:MAG: hypothetical protein H7Y00_07670 [Fimbriimonadaceae bacterium]|nr:hypothetical protein [Chitinophagales bacterium]